MKMRKKMPPKKDKRVFSKTAQKVLKKNIKRPMRGGYRI